ncbi:MAG TPA: carboxymuconolactone decarboxylase family protein [Acidimicrobiales bacterium]|jgi:alkylhydroperoxidase family enzyme|nr:carboxymuconolactone decarboxylase family protein [Acidimicrobiales bacterium]
MAHVPLNYDAPGVIPRLARTYTKKRFGTMVEPTGAASHHAGVLVAMGALETAAAMGWTKLDPSLRWLAIQAASADIGCSWCIDYGYYEGMNEGIDPAKVRAAASWRESDLFDERERAVLEYAERATVTPAEVSDELADRLHLHFSDPEIVELAAWVALENFRSRFNAGLGLRSQGFAEQCLVPPVPVQSSAGSASKEAGGPALV